MLNALYIKGILEMNGDKPNYPDANFTIRLTYGNVSPLNPADGISCRYYTTLDGVMEKEDPDNWGIRGVAWSKRIIQEKETLGNYRRYRRFYACKFYCKHSHDRR